MSERRCLCPCHDGGIADRMRADGVDVRDAVEAAVACSGCLRHHCAALLDGDVPERRPDELDDPVRRRSSAPMAITDNGEFAPPRPWSPADDARDKDTIDGEDGG